MKEHIKFLNEMRVITRASCCGHGRYPRTVICERTNINGEVTYFDICSGIIIPRKKKFYKKDSKGYYFIPEVSKEKR